MLELKPGIKLGYMNTPKRELCIDKEGPAWQMARAYGIDVSLLEDNLRLTPLERIRAHAHALNEALILQEAIRVQHGRS